MILFSWFYFNKVAHSLLQWFCLFLLLLILNVLLSFVCGTNKDIVILIMGRRVSTLWKLMERSWVLYSLSVTDPGRLYDNLNLSAVLDFWATHTHSSSIGLGPDRKCAN